MDQRRQARREQRTVQDKQERGGRRQWLPLLSRWMIHLIQSLIQCQILCPLGLEADRAVANDRALSHEERRRMECVQEQATGMQECLEEQATGEECLEEEEEAAAAAALLLLLLVVQGRRRVRARCSSLGS